MENTTTTLANGTIYDNEKGRIITGPAVPPFCKPEVRARAAETRRKRQEMTQNRILKGMCEKAVELGKIPLDTQHPAGEMVQAVAAQMAGYIWNDDIDDKGRLIVDVKARETVRRGLMQDAGLLAQQDRTGADGPQTVVNVLMTGDAQDRAVDLVREFMLKTGQ